MQKFGICISLTYNDLLEISAVWRTFYYLCRKNMRFVENLSHSRALISGVNIFYHIFYFLQKYMVVVCWTIILLAECLFWRRCPFYLKKFITTELIFKVLPFRVFNHLFCCSRSYYCSYRFFPSSIREGILLMHKVFFVHSYSAFVKEKIYSGRCNNFGVFYYGYISNPFILHKTNLELLCRIASQFRKRKSKI